MALHRGIQSAIFYYLSCAPCADARYRKKRKQDAIRGRAERAALEAEMPDMYRHPSPSSTNPHWQSEIAAGPVLAARGKRKGNATNDSRRAVKTSGTQRSGGSNVASSTDLSAVDGTSSKDGRVDSKWRFQQFQREDEPYVDSSTERLASSSTLDGSGSAASGIARPLKARVNDAQRYMEYKSPQVNDLHPAIATKVSSKEEAKWLMAPPPTADFMSGKERGSRSRSDSGGSKFSARSGVPLSREVSRRIMEQKIRNGEGPITPPLSRESTTSSDPAGQKHDRSTIDEKDFAFDGSPSRRFKQRTSPVLVGVSEDSTSSAQTVLRKPDSATEPTRARKVASRPQLSTIASDSLTPADTVGDDIFTSRKALNGSIRHSVGSIDERDRISRRAPLLANDESLKVLQDLAPASPILRTKIFSTQNFAREAKAKQTRHPSRDLYEDKRADGGPELFDSWYTPDFQLPEWIHEHTKREVTQRWSMDI